MTHSTAQTAFLARLGKTESQLNPAERAAFAKLAAATGSTDTPTGLDPDRVYADRKSAAGGDSD